MFLRVQAADGLQRTLVSAEREDTAAMAAGAVTSLMFSLAVERLILPQGHFTFTLTALSFHMKMHSQVVLSETERSAAVLLGFSQHDNHTKGFTENSPQKIENKSCEH